MAPQRILVYGVTGSGKTVLAERISAATGIPWHAIDDLTWEPGWHQVPFDEQRRRVAAICAGERWILDTAYSSWIDVPLERVELIVALDYPRLFSLYRLFRRTVGRAIDGRPICNGNRESCRSMFARDSILLWHFKSFAGKRRRIHGWGEQVRGARVLRFTRPRDVERWLSRLGS